LALKWTYGFSQGQSALDVQVCYCQSASDEAQTPRRKEVGTQEQGIPAIVTVEQAI